MRKILVLLTLVAMVSACSDDSVHDGCVTEAASDPTCVAKDASKPRAVVCSWRTDALQPPYATPTGCRAGTLSLHDGPSSSSRELHLCCPPEK